MSNVLRATKWMARAGPMVFGLGCAAYVDAYLTGDLYMALLGGMMWMAATAQWSLEYMEVGHA